MSRRIKSPLHALWHRRVEGQIRSCMQEHPEWFNFSNEGTRASCVSSLAKRIVGEIVAAGTVVATKQGEHGISCAPLDVR